MTLARSCWLLRAEQTWRGLPFGSRGDLPAVTELVCTHCPCQKIPGCSVILSCHWKSLNALVWVKFHGGGLSTPDTVRATLRSRAGPQASLLEEHLLLGVAHDPKVQSHRDSWDGGSHIWVPIRTT